MEIIIGTTFGKVSAVINILLALLILSWLFNRQIEHAGNRAEGWDWLLVVIGVTYTQLAVGLLDLVLDWNAFLIGMLAYAFSGFPMAYGAHKRHKDMQRRAQKAIHEQ